MVLVDSSVWIRFLMNREPWAEGLERLLSLDAVAGHDLVYGELLIGDKGGRRSTLEAYLQISWASTLAHREVVEFVRARKLYGRGVGWLDMHLVASAVVERVPLWTADKALALLAGELGLEYRPVN